MAAGRGLLGPPRVAADTGELALIVEAGSKLLRVERVVGQARTGRFEERPWTPAKRGKADGKGKQGPTPPQRMEIDDDDLDADGGKPTDTSEQATDAHMATQQGQANVSGKRPREGDQGRLGKGAWTEHECGGAGHCFYNCVAASFIMKTSSVTFQELVGQLGPKGRGLRSRIATHISEHPQLYQPYFEPSVVSLGAPDGQQALDDLKKIENGDPPTTWEEYTAAIVRPARYGDEIAFRAACALLGVNITLVCGDLDRPTQVLYYTKLINIG